jgi:hypothetical protein
MKFAEEKGQVGHGPGDKPREDSADLVAEASQLLTLVGGVA